MSQNRPQISESRDRVLHAAYGLFLRNGWSAVSMQQIADESGITKATLYHHFRHKNELFLETMRLAITRNERALTRSIASATTLPELVRSFIEYLFGDERADLQRLATDFKLHVSEESQLEFWKEHNLPWRLLQESVERVEDFDEERSIFISRYVYGATSGLSHLYRFEHERFPITDELLDHLTDCILHGLNPSRDR